VHLLFYIFENDEVGRQVADALLRAADRGVVVRVLMDAIGSRGGLKGLGPELRAAGVEVIAAQPLILWGPNAARFDLRNHRKIVVIDGAILGKPANAADAVGLLRQAMRSPNPTIFFEHRSLLMTGEGSAPYPGDDYVLPFGQARLVREGTEVTVVTWGAMVHRCAEAAERLGTAVELLDLRTIAPWDREAVLASVRRTGRCLVVHEDNRTAGFGAEVAGEVAEAAFWHLDAPVQRLAPRDIPMPYHPALLDAVLPGVDDIVAAVEALRRS
jgi:pyruvate/2-oxoglutarate/acetoin dehydrogenase E1 component